METREQKFSLALELLQKQFLEKEVQLQSLTNELRIFEREEKCGSLDVEDKVASGTSQRGSVRAREVLGRLEVRQSVLRRKCPSSGKVSQSVMFT